MHKWIVFKTILKFTLKLALKQLRQVSVQSHLQLLQCLLGLDHFHVYTVDLDSIEVFYCSPTDAQVNCLQNNFKIYIKIYINTAPTRFGTVTVWLYRNIFVIIAFELMTLLVLNILSPLYSYCLFL